MIQGHTSGLLLRCNIPYCASQQAEETGAMTDISNALATTALLLGCAVGATAASGEEESKPLQSGSASWYGPGFHGKRTANGETFNTHALTAAHKTLPFGTRIRVMNERTGKSVVV